MVDRESMGCNGSTARGVLIVKPLTDSEIGEYAERLGHTHVRVTPTSSGNRWEVACSCGFGAPMPDGRPTVTRATAEEAIRTVRHHLRKAVYAHLSETRGNGVSAFVRSAG